MHVEPFNIAGIILLTWARQATDNRVGVQIGAVVELYALRILKV